jgi:hypothetical protein
MTRPLTIIASLAGLILACTTHVQAAHVNGGGGGTVLLRYHFVPGQSLTYAVDSTERMINSNVAGLARILSSRIRTTGQTYQRVIRVDQHGAATIEESISQLAITSTIAGRRQRRNLPGQKIGTITVMTDGHIVGHVATTSLILDMQGTAALPDHPIRPGDAWTSVQNGVAFQPPNVCASGNSFIVYVTTELSQVVATTHSVLEVFSQQAGEPVAIIRSTRPLIQRSISQSGQLAVSSIHETESFSQTLLFGLTSGQPLLTDTWEVEHIMMRTKALGRTLLETTELTLHAMSRRIA